MPGCLIWVLIMRYIVDLVLLEELWCDNPGSFRDNFICPLAMADILTPVAPQGPQRMIRWQTDGNAPLLVIHYSVGFVFSNKLIRTDPNK